MYKHVQTYNIQAQEQQKFFKLATLTVLLEFF